MLFSIILWFIKVLTLLFLDIFTTIFSPILCLFVTKAEESDITGFPSLYQGKPREFLIKPLRWFQSTDAPLDELWYGDYDVWPKTGRTQEDYDSKWWLRYACRIVWLVRNPAYGFGTALGYSADGLVVTEEKDNEKDWRTGKGVQSFWKFTNSKGQIGWCYRAQIYYYKNHCLEMYLGYKLPGDTIRGNKLVAMQFTPFRQYPK